MDAKKYIHSLQMRMLAILIVTSFIARFFVNTYLTHEYYVAMIVSCVYGSYRITKTEKHYITESENKDIQNFINNIVPFKRGHTTVIVFCLISIGYDVFKEMYG
ncbi:MAG: hypothetical protein KC646_03675 [Candidatus Cloacimonetes bacterium]|nr:hypothetical protein [Candidatus Cloacimonadota bacterium]